MTQAVPRPADSVLRKIAGNGGWWLAERLGMLGLTLLTSVVVVRSLGPAGYGELSYVLALVGLLAPVVQFGVSGLVARGLLERPDDEAAVLRAALAMRFAGAATALAIGLAWWFFFEPRPGDRWIVLVLLAAQAATSFQVVESWFQVHFRASALVPWRTSVIVAAALLKMGVALATGDARPVAMVFALEYVALGLASLLALRRAGGPLMGAGDPSGWLRWFAVRSPWLLASGVAEVIYLRIDIVLLERLRGVEEAGTYAVAARLSEVWYMVPVALMGAIFPVLWSRRTDPVAYARSLQGSLDGLFAMAFVLAVIVQLVGGPLVELLFGERFAASTPVLQIHIWAGVFIFMRALLSRWLLAEDLLRFSLVTHVAGAVMNVALNLLLIPRYGATGAALATVASYACAGWLALFLSERTRPMGRAMAKSLLLPFRWGDLAVYARRISSEWRGRAESLP
jgi:PST family polysaccharide transporter